jgi:hypothetical protein
MALKDQQSGETCSKEQSPQTTPSVLEPPLKPFSTLLQQAISRQSRNSPTDWMARHRSKLSQLTKKAGV